MKYPREQQSHHGHDGKVAEQSDQHAFPCASQSCKITKAHLDAHTKHHKLHNEQDQPFAAQIKITPFGKS